MADVTETQLPGVGVRYEYTTASGRRAGVVAHRSGRREVFVEDEHDPDVCHTVLSLDSDDARTLTDLLGASQVTEAVAAVQQQVEGLAIDWLTVAEGGSADGATIGECGFRTSTGASVVAIVRGETTLPAPGPETRLAADDVLVSVGTPDGLEQLSNLLRA